MTQFLSLKFLACETVAGWFRIPHIRQALQRDWNVSGLCTAEVMSRFSQPWSKEDIALSGPNDFDLSAAGFRRSESDLRAFIEAFAVRMESALPSQTVVQRKKDGLFSKQSHVVNVSIETVNHRYALSFQAGRLSAERSKVVRGVTLKNEPMEVPAWLESLGMDVEALATHSGSAQNVLHDFLMS